VQVIPHITNEIKERMLAMAGPDVDVVLTRSAARSATSSRCRSSRPRGRSATTSAATTCSSCTSRWSRTSAPSGELKTKPTQHSVAALRSIGIAPDAVVCRADRPIPTREAEDLADVRRRPGGRGGRAATRRRSTTSPRCCTREGLDAYVVRRLNLPVPRCRLDPWDELLRVVHHPKDEVTVALVGKYIDLPDAYLSVAEALRAGGFDNDARVNLRWIASDECATPRRGPAARRRRRDLHPGGFGDPRLSRARSARSGSPASTASRSWGCAWACSAW
jgi:CTP synthase